MWRVMAAVVFSVGLMGAAGAQQVSLRDVPQIDNGLFVVGLADQIRKRCPVISARFFRAINYLRTLEKEARALGYSEAEVTRHLESDAEKNRLRARAKVYMTDRGYGQNETGYCALGRAEIAQETNIGALLRLRN
ncbi:MAG: DUF5333 domain-containing protein [Roseobacter sp.]